MASTKRRRSAGTFASWCANNAAACVLPLGLDADVVGWIVAVMRSSGAMNGIENVTALERNLNSVNRRKEMNETEAKLVELYEKAFGGRDRTFHVMGDGVILACDEGGGVSVTPFDPVPALCDWFGGFATLKLLAALLDYASELTLKHKGEIRREYSVNIHAGEKWVSDRRLAEEVQAIYQQMYPLANVMLVERLRGGKP
jgi:hypothetical protein